MRPRTAIRSLLWAALLLALVAPAAAMADADNDISGAAIVGVGQSAEGHVDAATDPVDVWAIPLVAGEEVSITVEPTANGDGDALFLAAGITNLTQSDSFSIVTMPVKQSGTYFRLTYTFAQVYTPTRSANYYVRVTCDGAPLGYRISVRRTASPPINTPDSNDIPGLAIGAGAVMGVVDGRTDRNDVYRVKLSAGRPVTFRLRAANNTKGSGWLSVLDPDSVSVLSYNRTTTKFAGKSLSERADSDEEAVLQFVPPVSAVYFLWVQSNTVFAKNFSYMLVVEGNASVPGPPTRASLTPPSVPASTIGRYRSFSSSGLLGPKHVLRPYGSLVIVYLDHLENGRYVTRRKYTARNADAGSYTRYSVSFIYPGAPGRWRLRAYHKDTEHLASWSAPRYFTVANR